MLGHTALEKMKAQRGPRHLVYGTVRRNEFRANYAVSAARADEAAERFRADGLRQVTVLAPATVDAEHADVLREAAIIWRAARDAEVDLRQQLAAAVVTAVEAGMSESETARLAGVDRMTVRGWLGKR